ncbi:hypothetical protein AAC387_Pa02g1294 [Persea americana]
MPSIQIDSSRSSSFDDHQNETTHINGDGAQTFSYDDGHESIFQEDCRSDPFNLIDLNMNMHLPQQPEMAYVPQEIIGEPCNTTLNLNLVDTLVPDSLVMGDDQNINSMHEMWKGRKFSNRDSFREALAKATMYDNFAMKRLKLQHGVMKVTVLGISTQHLLTPAQKFRLGHTMVLILVRSQ